MPTYGPYYTSELRAVRGQRKAVTGREEFAPHEMEAIVRGELTSRYAAERSNRALQRNYELALAQQGLAERTATAQIGFEGQRVALAEREAGFQEEAYKTAGKLEATKLALQTMGPLTEQITPTTTQPQVTRGELGRSYVVRGYERTWPGQVGRFLGRAATGTSSYVTTGANQPLGLIMGATGIFGLLGETVGKVSTNLLNAVADLFGGARPPTLTAFEPGLTPETWGVTTPTTLTDYPGPMTGPAWEVPPYDFGDISGGYGDYGDYSTDSYSGYGHGEAW